MKKIFYNAKIYGQNEESVNSIFINDDRIFCVGTKDDVLFQKNEDVELCDLNGSEITLSAYNYTKSLYEKTAKNIKFKSKTENFYDNIKKFQNNCIKSGIATVAYIIQDEEEFSDLKILAEEGKLKIDFLCFIDIAKCKKVMDENCSSFHSYKKHLKIGGYYLQVDGEYKSHEAWVKRKHKGTKNAYGYPLVNEKHLEHYLKCAFDHKKQIIVEANGDRSVDLLLGVVESLRENEKFADSKVTLQNNGLLNGRQIKLMLNLRVDLIKIKNNQSENFLNRIHRKRESNKIAKSNINCFYSFENFDAYGDIYFNGNDKLKGNRLNLISLAPCTIFGEEQKCSFEAGAVAIFCVVDDQIKLFINGENITQIGD